MFAIASILKDGVNRIGEKPSKKDPNRMVAILRGDVDFESVAEVAGKITPLIDAIERDLSPAEVVANPVEVGDTIAGAIADDILFDAYTALPAIRESGGRAVSISDDEMLEAEALLARKAGVFAEPASASTIAAIETLRGSNAIGSGDSVCCIITGAGFKDMASAKSLVGAPKQIEAKIQAFLQLD